MEIWSIGYQWTNLSLSLSVMGVGICMAEFGISIAYV